MAIEPGNLYSEDEVVQKLGIRDKSTLESARQRKGMPSRRIGYARVYLGDELIEWVAQLPPSGGDATE